MNIYDGFNDSFDAAARLVILKALASEDAGRLSDWMLMHAFEEFAINRTRDYLLTQLRWLETEAGAVILRPAGTVVIAQLTEQGEAHLHRKQLIVGVKPPSLPRT